MFVAHNRLYSFPARWHDVRLRRIGIEKPSAGRDGDAFC